MRIVFMGSSDASAKVLEQILRYPELKVVGVVTQPERPHGRGRKKLLPCPCGQFAIDRKLEPILTPEKVNAPEAVKQIADLKPDVIVVVAFGQILKGELLNLPKYGCINGHFSLLPKYRGAAPVQAAILDGEYATGVTIMQMAPGLDDGDILKQRIQPIARDEGAVSGMANLATACASAMCAVLLKLQYGEPLAPTPQDHSLATYAPKIQKTDGLIDWQKTAMAISRQIRAYEIWPGAYTYLPERFKRPKHSGYLKVLFCKVLEEFPPDYDKFVPGQICLITKRGPVVRTGGRPLLLTVLQPEGGTRMDGHAFLQGRALQTGDRFGSIPWSAQ